MHYISAENFILGNSNVYLFVKDLPSFNTVYDYFLSCKVPFLKINKQQDICLSLFYDPYFNEFYKEIIKDSKSIPEHRKNFLIKYLLSSLSDPIQYQIINQYCDVEKKHFLKYDLFNRSKELMQILQSK